MLADVHLSNRYQTNTVSLTASWIVVDPESGIKEIRYTLYKKYGGTKERIHPLTNDPPYAIVQIGKMLHAS
jgi:hypothetical protein